MDLNSFLKTNKATILYSYSENILANGSKEFGWEVGDNIPDEDIFVLSTPSRSKKFSESDLERSKQHGSNLTTLSDYRKFFSSFTGHSPEDFIGKYSSDEALLVSDWDGISKNIVRDDEAKFYLNLAKLITEEKKFSMYGRIFKIYSTGT